jgi:hypothetical protein
MTTSTLGLIIIAIVTVIVLAVWITLVFHADAHPAWRRQVPSGHDTVGQARMTARQEEESTDFASREAEGFASAGPDAGASAAPTGGTAPDKARTG